MRYRQPLITFVHGPEDSSRRSLAEALYQHFTGDLWKVQFIDGFKGDDLPIERWKCPDRVVVVSDAPPSKAFEKQCYEVIAVTARRRPAWLRRRIAKKRAGLLRGNETGVSQYDLRGAP